MNTNTKRILFYVIPTILATVLIAFLLYKSFRTVVQIRKDTQIQESLVTIVSLGDLVEKADSEQFENARFVGVKGINYLDRLEAARQEVDHALEEALKDTTDTASAWLSQADLRHFTDDLKSMRKHVDLLKPYKNQNPLSSLLVRLKTRTERLTQADIPVELMRYVQSLDYMASFSDERSLIAFFLARRLPLSEDDLHAWETIMEHRGVQAFRQAGNTPLVSGFQKDNNVAMMRNRLAVIQADLFEHATDGKYATQLFDMENLFFEPMLAVSHARKQWIKEIDATLERTQRDNKASLIQYMLAVVFLVGLLFLLYRYLKTVKKEKIALRESLKEVASDLDEDRRKELEVIMEKGDRVGVYKFLSKMTLEAREAEERALEAERTKDHFLANVSHEIRTPLNGILGFAQLMQSTKLSAEQEEFMSVIEGSSDNLLKIVNDILDLSKMHAEKIELERIPFSLIKHFEQAIEPHAARALEQGIEYSTFIDPTLPMIHGDPTKLTQIMTNLIGNAVKFTKEGGAVEIDVRKIKESDTDINIRFSVKDSGIGISAEQKKKIFEPFSQADASTTRKFGGTGLGLTITREIVQHMGGFLDVDSRLGSGSEFHFELVFDKAGADEDIYDRLEGVRLGYYHAGQTTLRQVERNLALYARACGARFRTIEEHDLDFLDDVDILLLDYTDKATQANIEKLLWLGKKTILISTAAQKHETDNLVNRVDKVIYHPLTASKLIRAYEDMSDKHQDDEEVSVESLENVTLEGLRILVAEDNLINQKLIGRVLEGMHTLPTLVNNGKEAVEMRIAQEYDAILMDIQMPVMGGEEAVKKILDYEYENGATHVPVVALTANALIGDRERYIRKGFDDYVSKPININQLRQVLLTYSNKQLAVVDPKQDKGPSKLELGLELFTLQVVLMYSKSMGLVQRIHSDALTHAGHTFSSVGSEDILFEALKSKRPDVIVLDMHSITLSSCDVINQLRKSGAKVFFYGNVSDMDSTCNTEKMIQYSSVSTLVKALK